MGAWPCGKIVMLGELFGSESMSQVYGQVHTLLQENPQQFSNLRKSEVMYIDHIILLYMQSLFIHVLDQIYLYTYCLLYVTLIIFVQVSSYMMMLAISKSMLVILYERT